MVDAVIDTAFGTDEETEENRTIIRTIDSREKTPTYVSASLSLSLSIYSIFPSAMSHVYN